MYVAGDASGVEEASSAMVEGRLSGLCAAKNLGYSTSDTDLLIKDCMEQLSALRSGPVGEKIRKGLDKVLV
jgi:sarcosine oxidase subunit alpha